MSDTNSISATRAWKIMWGFAKTTAFERYGVKTSEKANMHNQHWLTSTRFSPFNARIKLQRGYLSKSCAALNPLTIMQLACEGPRDRSRIALLGPVH